MVWYGIGDRVDKKKKTDFHWIEPTCTYDLSLTKLQIGLGFVKAFNMEIVKGMSLV